MARRCEGFGRGLQGGERLVRCDRDALWEREGRAYCFFCLRVVEGWLKGAWDGKAKRERPKPRHPLDVLMEEWA